jgi:hypothetical protein
MMKVMGSDGMERDLDEHYNTILDVKEDPFGAHEAIQNLWAENAKLRAALQAMRAVFDTPIARRKHGGEYATEARRLAQEAVYLPINLKKGTE